MISVVDSSLELAAIVAELRDEAEVIACISCLEGASSPRRARLGGNLRPGENPGAANKASGPERRGTVAAKLSETHPVIMLKERHLWRQRS